MCEEMCGKRDVLDDKVTNQLALLVDQMVENVVDHSCMYARHRSSDTLEKEDVSFAVGQLFPEIARDHKVRDVQVLIDQQVNINHASNSMPASGQVPASGGAAIPGVAGAGGAAAVTCIGVGGQVSTANYKSKLLRVRKEQDVKMQLSNVQESLKQASNFGAGYLGYQAGAQGQRPNANRP